MLCCDPGDLLLSITGKPYDTLDSIIGFNDNPSSLKSFGIKYDQIDLVDNHFDYDAISNYLKNNRVKVIEIQRSIGYSTRSSIGIEDIEEVIRLVKGIDKNIIVMVVIAIVNLLVNLNLRKLVQIFVLDH